MEKEKYLSDLKDIKSMMDRSSRFISLSGISGVVAGTLALAGAYVAYETIYVRQDYFDYRRVDMNTETLLSLFGIAMTVLVLSLAAGIYFTQIRAKKTKQSLWDAQARRMVINLFIPLVAGGLLCLILLSKGFIGLIAPLTLIFYGLGLVNASKYTLTEVRSLGMAEVILGLLACQFIGYGLIFWAIGFGALHIIYGLAMYAKYDREGNSERS